MTESNEPFPSTAPVAPAPTSGSALPPPPPPYAQAPVPAPGAMPAYGYQTGAAPIGKVRSTGTCILLTIVTLGFYTWYWYYSTHEEMKRHTGEGLGGPIALVLAIFVSFLSPFFSSHEVGKLYERRGQPAPVSAVTGLWFILLGWFFFVGAFVWFVKTNGALNDYWRSVGATD